MTEQTSLEENWRVVFACGLEAQVRTVERWLQDTLDVEELFAGEEQVVHAIRSAAALVRERRTEYVDEARRLRAAAVEP